VMTCGQCGTNLNNVPVNDPCPRCRSTRRNAHVRGTAAVGTGAGMSGGIKIGYAPNRPWYAQWHSVRERLSTVDAHCRPAAYLGNLPLQRDFEDFFTNCFHMVDWLCNDPAVNLSAAQVRSFVDNDPDLHICAGIANTTKHHTRSRPNKMTAKISSIASNPTSVQVMIDWSEGQNNGTENALELARRCVKAWERYLAANGLQSPI
jgi:hypothetical protein